MGRFARKLWQAWRKRIARLRPRDNHFALVLRLENIDLLLDRLGQAGMGHLLVHLSMRLSAALRPQDPVQIISPDQFSVLLRSRSEAEAMAIAQRLQVQGQAEIAVAGRSITPVLSGVIIGGKPGETLPDQDLFDNARQRLAHLDAGYLGQISLFEVQATQAAVALPVTVRDAVKSNQMIAYFQPQICCNSGRVTGFETLARWNHPSRGLLPPGAFMPGMNGQDHGALTLTMLRQALSAIKCWDAEGWDVPSVSLNISNCELGDANFASNLLWELDRQDIAPHRLVLEVLESVGPVSSNSAARANLAQFARAGCQIDLDDFGTGYASLDAIRQFGVNRIKIDRSFVVGCDVDPGQQRMILAILALAERLQISTLAEGVETREEHAYLAQLGCDEVQGYAIARPMPLDKTLIFLADHATRRESLPRLNAKKAG